MIKSTFHASMGFVEAVLAAQPSDIEFVEQELWPHAAERRKGITRTGYAPARILGEPVPDGMKIVYTHRQHEGCSKWHVINSMKHSGSSPYISFEVASDEEARSAILQEIKDALRLHRTV